MCQIFFGLQCIPDDPILVTVFQLFSLQVDKLKSKHQLLTIIRNLTNGYIAGNPIPGPDKNTKKEKKIEKGYHKFSDVFLISALNGDGVNDIKVSYIYYI